MIRPGPEISGKEEFSDRLRPNGQFLFFPLNVGEAGSFFPDPRLLKTCSTEGREGFCDSHWLRCSSGVNFLLTKGNFGRSGMP
jgi:hypothetical protein